MFRVDWDLTAEVPKTGRQVRGPAFSPQAFELPLFHITFFEV